MVAGSQARKVMGLRRVNSMEIENPWLDFFRGVGSAASHNPMTMPPPPPPSPAEETQGDWGKVQGRGGLSTTAKPRPATTPPPKKPPPGRTAGQQDNPTIRQQGNRTIRLSDCPTIRLAWFVLRVRVRGSLHWRGADGRTLPGRCRVAGQNIFTFSHDRG